MIVCKRICFIRCIPFILFISFILIPLTMHTQVDKKATKETQALYLNLFKLREQGVMFGQQDAMAYGLNQDKTRWVGDINRSDVKSITGAHPAVVGHDLGHLELKNTYNLDSVSFDHIRASIYQVYVQGGINTLSWHPNNPLDLKKSAWDKVEKTIPGILNDPKQLRRYKKILTGLSKYFKSLKGPHGELIPIIFRPYHEHTGSWFWWGAGHCTPEEYKSFWRMTVDHLIKKKKVHNILFAYSTDNFKSEEHYLERYPGDDYIDLLGFDTYHRNAPLSDSNFIANAKRMVGTIKKLGTEKNKLYAITETGLERISENDWWTRILNPILAESGLSYVLVWRNGRPDHFYAPFEGQSSAEDFKTFYSLPNTLFEKDLINIYK